MKITKDKLIFDDEGKKTISVSDLQGLGEMLNVFGSFLEDGSRRLTLEGSPNLAPFLKAMANQQKETRKDRWEAETELDRKDGDGLLLTDRGFYDLKSVTPIRGYHFDNVQAGRIMHHNKYAIIANVQEVQVVGSDQSTFYKIGLSAGSEINLHSDPNQFTIDSNTFTYDESTNTIYRMHNDEKVLYEADNYILTESHLYHDGNATSVGSLINTPTDGMVFPNGSYILIDADKNYEIGFTNGEIFDGTFPESFGKINKDRSYIDDTSYIISDEDGTQLKWNGGEFVEMWIKIGANFNGEPIFDERTINGNEYVLTSNGLYNGTDKEMVLPQHLSESYSGGCIVSDTEVIFVNNRQVVVLQEGATLLYTIDLSQFNIDHIGERVFTVSGYEFHYDNTTIYRMHGGEKVLHEVDKYILTESNLYHDGNATSVGSLITTPTDGMVFPNGSYILIDADKNYEIGFTNGEVFDGTFPESFGELKKDRSYNGSIGDINIFDENDTQLKWNGGEFVEIGANSP